MSEPEKIRSDRRHSVDLLKEGDGVVIRDKVSLTAITFCHSVIAECIDYYLEQYKFDCTNLIKLIGDSLVRDFFNPKVLNVFEAELTEDGDNEYEALFIWHDIVTSLTNEISVPDRQDIKLTDADCAYLYSVASLYALGISDLSFLPLGEFFSKETLMMIAARKAIKASVDVKIQGDDVKKNGFSSEVKGLRRDFAKENQKKMIVVSKALERVRARGGLREKETLGQAIADEAMTMKCTKKNGKPFTVRACEEWKREYWRLPVNERKAIEDFIRNADSV